MSELPKETPINPGLSSVTSREQGGSSVTEQTMPHSGGKNVPEELREQPVREFPNTSLEEAVSQGYLEVPTSPSIIPEAQPAPEKEGRSLKTKLIAIGAAVLATAGAVTAAMGIGNAANNGTTAPETPVGPTPTEIGGTPTAEQPTKTPEFKTSVPKFRENWNVNRSAFIDLYNLHKEVKETVPYGDPEFETLRQTVRSEFLANNPVPGELQPPTSKASNEEIFAWHAAVSELYRQYYSDVEREQRIRDVNETGGVGNSQSDEDQAVLNGIELALFNGLDDSLALHEDAFIFSVMGNDGTGDTDLPTVSYTFKRGEETGGVGQEWSVRSIWSDVTVEGTPTQEVMTRFNWNERTQYWDLTAELSGDGTKGSKIY